MIRRPPISTRPDTLFPHTTLFRSTRGVTVELGASGGGNRVWTHPGGFSSYHQARTDRFARFEELRKRWDEEHAKIKALVLRLKIKSEYNDGMSSQYRAARPGCASSRRPVRRPSSPASNRSRCGSRAVAPASAR